MRVAFNSSIEDITLLHEALLIRQRAQGKATKPGKVLLVMAVSLAALIAALWALLQQPPYFFILVSVIFLLVYALNSKTAYRNKLHKHFQRIRGGDGWLACIIEINDHGLSMISSDNTMVFWWPQISEISQENGFLRFYTHQGSAAQVPLRVFRHSEEFAAFEAEARKLHRIHQNDPPVIFPETSGLITDDIPAPSCTLVNPALSASPTESP